MADLLWPFAAHGPATEVLDWRTDVLQSDAGEQRLSLRDTPREVLTLSHRLDGPKLAEALALARRGMAGEWIVPLWHMADRSGSDITLGETSLTIAARHADYRAPGFAVAASNGGDAYLLTLAAVHPDGIDLTATAGVALTHPVIAPARRARLLAPLEIEHRHADLGYVTARFLLQESADLSGLRGTALYIAIDTSTSMSGAKITAAMAAVRALVDELAGTVPPALRNDICILLWHETVADMQVRRDADRQDLTYLSDWLAQPPVLRGGTDFAMALSEAQGFFAGAGAKRRIILFLTDGEPYPLGSATAAVALLETIADVEVYGFNIGLTNTSWTAMLDNTPADGVPVIAPGDTDSLRDTLLGTLFGIPRYRGRDVLMDPSVLRQPLAQTLSQSFEGVDSGLGPVIFEPLRDLVEHGSVLTLKDVGPEDSWSRRRWLYHLRGRARAFWLPSWGRELVLQQEALAGDDVLIVAPRLEPSDWIGRPVLLDLPGQPIFREITGTSLDPLGLRLGIDPLDRHVPITTPGHLLTLVRLDTDRVEIEHRPAGTEVSLTVLDIPDLTP
ncbi:VWA domain-containing protein [Ruegeria sp. 1NDH52C]|uniref:VWA domain-containing protein n=1 Tax=Ruegeria alba TaxID=2916756 RepID=A0ABS9P2N5_9RHOB|nr:vWA domain-containing protein [Ruegeria alba]MCG6560753.1 VWA domain-containing protein [Ruegeria alba]